MEKAKEINLENLTNVKDYAKSMGVTTQTVYNWINSGRVKTVSVLCVEFIDKTSFDYKVRATNATSKK